MLSRQELAQLIDGPAFEREISRMSNLGGGWVDAAMVLSRRINRTIDWEELGPEGARYRIVSTRGEGVIFWDNEAETPTVVKLRGREENGFDDAGFGCILGRNALGRVDYAPGTIDDAIERERLTWEAFGFSCRVRDVVEDGVALLLEQDFIQGDAPGEAEIRDFMTAAGWEWLRSDPGVSRMVASHAWRKGDIGAFDANPTNFVKSSVDGQIYPIDLIVWHWPS